jgi:predicted nucleotidyltransferase
VLSLEEIRNAVAEVAPDYDVDKILLFGSYARGEADKWSDVDIHVWGGNWTSLWDFEGFRLDLRKKLGVSVDIVSDDFGDPSVLSEIEREEILLYVKDKQGHEALVQDC